MKKRFTFFVFLLLFFSISRLNAQPGEGNEPIIPLQQNRSILFGKDIVIHDQPNNNQRNLAICSAFNGWLFSGYSYTSSTGERCSLLKSIDDGITWSIIMDDVVPYSYVISKISLTTSGNNLSNLRLFLGVMMKDTNDNTGHLWVGHYKVEPFGPDGEAFGDPNNCRDLSLSNDFTYPATGSNPNSLGLIFSKHGIRDSIVFKSSSNGETFNTDRGIAGSTSYFGKVALGYGSSLSYSTGRYFAVWEEKDNENANTGHIYTSHSEPNFNGVFTKPFCLDSLDPTDINLCRNPVIACQYGEMDNDSSNLTSVILFEKYNPVTSKFEIKGYFNKKSTLTNYFKSFSITDPNNNNLQSAVSFNPYNSIFMVTYFDSTEQKLLFLTNNFNLQNPYSWNVVSPGYNDSSNISDPYPKVEVTPSQQQGVNAWISEGIGGKGIAMFDAQYSTWTGISEINKTTEFRLIGAYPNPCSNEVKIAFEIKKAGKATINLFNILGQPLGTITDQSYSEGRNMVKYNVSDLPEGTYLYYFKSGDFTTSGKFTVMR